MIQTWNAFTRRSLLRLGGSGVVAAGAGLTGQTASADAKMIRSITVTEGTNMALAASPDGQTLAIDLYGILWLLPLAGGSGRRLTENVQEINQPDWSPDGRRLVFQSYRDGNYHLWMIDADGSDLQQITTGPYDDREPRFSPDGTRIAFSSDRSGRYAVHVLILATGVVGQVSSGVTDEYEPSWSPDGRSLAFTVDHSRIDIQDPSGARRVAAQIKPSTDRFAPHSLSSPCFTRDGKDVVFALFGDGKAELHTGSGRPLVLGEDVFPFRVAWMANGDFLYTADGRIKRRTPGVPDPRLIPFSVTTDVTRPGYAKTHRDFESSGPRPVVGVGAPALSPDGRAVAFRALNDIYLMTIGERARPLTQDHFNKVDPCWSPDGRTLAYCCDRGGTFDIWLRHLGSGEDRQLTQFSDAALSPSWSRDGRMIAFLSQNGGLFVADAVTGSCRRIYEDLWEPGKPSWSADGQTIAYAAFKPYSHRFREGLSEILTVNVQTGEAAYQPVFANRSLGTRGDDGPVWSPDGARLAFVFASRLWTVRVDERGRFLDQPKALNEEVSDAPTWSGDSQSLLYLSAGRLRLISAQGGTAETLQTGLTWANAAPAPRSILHAGRLWDGLNDGVRENADVVMQGGRIAAVLPHEPSQSDANAKRIDASANFVMPGLMDMHCHRQMQGYGYGDRDGRLWLSLGVTTTRSPGGPAYHAIEDREAIDSGARVGPRYYTTGEAIDGSRIFYNFMRPVTEPGQMALELARAQALDYDLIKTYVRLPADKQKAVMDWAHARGRPVTSHYHYPALAFGMDGMEHLGATARTGYSRTVSALGNVYEDVTAAFLATGASRTPTLFTSTVLFGDDRSLVDDARIKTLYPPWEYARLLERASQMALVDKAPLFEELRNNIGALIVTVRGGGTIISGTDSPIDFNAVSLHMNLRAMVRFGMSPAEALTSATRTAGAFLDEPLGVIRAGAYADLLIANGDPLSRIEDAADVVMTIKGGEAFTPDDLMRPFQARSASPAAAASPRPAFRCSAGPTYWWHGQDFVNHARQSCCDQRSWPAIKALA